MSKQELKSKIVESINQSENELLLTEIYAMLNGDVLLDENGYKISEGEKEALSRGLKDFEEGKLITDQEVRKPYAKYFK